MQDQKANQPKVRIPPSLTEQADVLREWWDVIVQRFVKLQKKQADEEKKKGNSIQQFVVEKRLVIDIPIDQLINYFIDERLVQKVQTARKFIE